MQAENPGFIETHCVFDGIRELCKREADHLVSDEVVRRVVKKTKLQVLRAMAAVREQYERRAREQLQELESQVELTTAAMCKTALSNHIQDKFGMLRDDVEKSVARDPSCIKKVALESKKLQDKKRAVENDDEFSKKVAQQVQNLYDRRSY